MQTAKTVSGAPKVLFTRGSDGEKLSAKAGANGFEYSVFLIYTYRSGILDLAQAVGRRKLLYPGGNKGTISRIVKGTKEDSTVLHRLPLHVICMKKL